MRLCSLRQLRWVLLRPAQRSTRSSLASLRCCPLVAAVDRYVRHVGTRRGRTWLERDGDGSTSSAGRGSSLATTCLVGKLPKAARQDCWPLFARMSCKGVRRKGELTGPHRRRSITRSCLGGFDRRRSHEAPRAPYRISDVDGRSGCRRRSSRTRPAPRPGRHASETWRFPATLLSKARCESAI